MNIHTFLQILRSRWWVIVVTTALAAGGAYLSAHRQPTVYQAMATTLVHPIGGARGGDPTSKDSLLSYSSLADTFAGMAQSHTYQTQAGVALGVPPVALAHYTVKAAPLPMQDLLQVTVAGPNPGVAARIANDLVRRVGRAVARYYYVFTLTPLDDAVAPVAPIAPKPTQAALNAGIAGLIVGYVLAALSLRLSMASGSAAAASVPVPGPGSARGPTPVPAPFNTGSAAGGGQGQRHWAPEWNAGAGTGDALDPSERHIVSHRPTGAGVGGDRVAAQGYSGTEQDREQEWAAEPTSTHSATAPVARGETGRAGR